MSLEPMTATTNDMSFGTNDSHFLERHVVCHLNNDVIHHVMTLSDTSSATCSYQILTCGTIGWQCMSKSVYSMWHHHNSSLGSITTIKLYWTVTVELTNTAHKLSPMPSLGQARKFKYSPKFFFKKGASIFKTFVIKQAQNVF